MRSDYWDKETEDEVAEQEEAAERCECYDLTTAQARIAELEGERDLARKAVGEVGLALDAMGSGRKRGRGYTVGYIRAIVYNFLHKGVVKGDGSWIKAFEEDRAKLNRADTLQAQVGRLTEGLEKGNHALDWVISGFPDDEDLNGAAEILSANIELIAKAALTPDGKGG